MAGPHSGVLAHLLAVMDAPGPGAVWRVPQLVQAMPGYKRRAIQNAITRGRQGNYLQITEPGHYRRTTKAGPPCAVQPVVALAPGQLVPLGAPVREVPRSRVSQPKPHQALVTLPGSRPVRQAHTAHLPGAPVEIRGDMRPRGEVDYSRARVTVCPAPGALGVAGRLGLGDAGPVPTVFSRLGVGRYLDGGAK